MISSMPIDKSVFAQNWGKFLLWGVALVILGMLAISAAVFTTMLTVVLLGVIVLCAGAIIIVDAWTFWRGKVSGFLLHSFMGMLYLIVGFMLIRNPLEGSVSITLILGVFYMVLGGFRIIYALTHRAPRWGLNLLNGVVSFVLGGLILANWPFSSLYIIGLFVGIDLLFCGWVYMMSALAARAQIR